MMCLSVNVFVCNCVCFVCVYVETDCLCLRATLIGLFCLCWSACLCVFVVDLIGRFVLTC